MDFNNNYFVTLSLCNFVTLSLSKCVVGGLRQAQTDRQTQTDEIIFNLMVPCDL